MKLLYLTLALCCTAMNGQQLPSPTKQPEEGLRSNEIRTQMQTAEAALGRGDYASALPLLKVLSTERPKDAQVAYDLGFAEEHAGDEAAAAAAYAHAAEVDPAMAEPVLALGLMDARAGREEKARTELRSAASLQAATSDLRARALRALATLDERTQPEVARDELLQAVRLSSETPEDLAMTARLAAQAGDPADAEAAYRLALAANPNDPAATASLAAVLLKRGKKEEAEKLLRNALSAHPHDPELVTQLAALYGETNRANDGVQLLQQTRVANPQLASDPSIIRMLARLESLSGQDADSAELYAKLAGSGGAAAMLLDEYGGVLVKLARFAEAQAVFTRALSKREDFPSDQDWAETESHLAFAASRNHEPKLALQALALRATVLPNSPSSLFLQAISYDALRQNGEAVKAYRSFLAVANGKYPDQEFQARHRLVTLEHTR